MDRRERSRAQAATMIWAIRGAAILLLGVLLLLAAMKSDAQAGVGFESAAPGWYNGGAPYDPIGALRAWE